MTAPTGVLVMAYGTAAGPEDVERYYTDIRGGRAPTRRALDELKGRYRAIGNRFPLLDITRAQAEGIARALNEVGDGEHHAYVGMKHSEPFIEGTVEEMKADGIERAIGIVMAPHWSGMSVETYIDRVNTAVDGGGPAFTFVRQWFDHPLFVTFLAERVAGALVKLGPSAREGAAVVFSAHSLPTRTGEEGATLCLRCDECETSCRYDEQLRVTAGAVAAQLVVEDYTTAWQSAGHTADPWRGPGLEDVIRELAAGGRTGVVVCPAGFVADHLEILYDLDIEAREVAQSLGIGFARTEMPNADATFTSAVAAVVREHLEKEASS
jgi:ferrochelatase